VRAVNIYDDVLPNGVRKEVYDFLMDSGWRFGWKSRSAKDEFAFRHKHL
jgi:hypothetical protein